MGEYLFLAGSGLYSERFMQEFPAQAKRLISEVVAQADYEVQRILLFGSRARGEALPDSDWDFFVITDCESSPEEKRVIQMELIPNFQQRVSAWEEGHWRLAAAQKESLYWEMVSEPWLSSSTKQMRGFFACLLS